MNNDYLEIFGGVVRLTGWRATAGMITLLVIGAGLVLWGLS